MRAHPAPLGIPSPSTAANTNLITAEAGAPGGSALIDTASSQSRRRTAKPEPIGVGEGRWKPIGER